MMRLLTHMFLVAALACTLGACGNKGKLKSPAQIEAAAAKKQHRKSSQAEQPGDAASSVKTPDVVKTSDSEKPDVNSPGEGEHVPGNTDTADHLVGAVKK